jgi:hypothetical protein
VKSSAAAVKSSAAAVKSSTMRLGRSGR